MLCIVCYSLELGLTSWSGKLKLKKKVILLEEKTDKIYKKKYNKVKQNHLLHIDCLKRPLRTIVRDIRIARFFYKLSQLNSTSLYSRQKKENTHVILMFYPFYPGWAVIISKKLHRLLTASMNSLDFDLQAD